MPAKSFALSCASASISRASSPLTDRHRRASSPQRRGARRDQTVLRDRRVTAVRRYGVARRNAWILRREERNRVPDEEVASTPFERVADRVATRAGRLRPQREVAGARRVRDVVREVVRHRRSSSRVPPRRRAVRGQAARAPWSPAARAERAGLLQPLPSPESARAPNLPTQSPPRTRTRSGAACRRRSCPSSPAPRAECRCRSRSPSSSRRTRARSTARRCASSRLPGTSRMARIASLDDVRARASARNMPLIGAVVDLDRPLVGLVVLHERRARGPLVGQQSAEQPRAAFAADPELMVRRRLSAPLYSASAPSAEFAFPAQ